MNNYWLNRKQSELKSVNCRWGSDQIMDFHFEFNSGRRYKCNKVNDGLVTKLVCGESAEMLDIEFDTIESIVNKYYELE